MQINLATIERQAGERLKELEGAPSHEERVEAIKRFSRPKLIGSSCAIDSELAEQRSFALAA